MQSVPITTKVVSSNPVNVEVYSIQFDSDLRQFAGFLHLDDHDITEILLKVELNTINLNLMNTQSLLSQKGRHIFMSLKLPLFEVPF
jgi:hypothetical protein